MSSSLFQRTRLGWSLLPGMVRGLILAQAVLYLAAVIVGREPGPQAALALLALDPSRVLAGEAWRPLTYLWLHEASDLLGLLFDLLILWTFGGLFGQRWRRSHFLFFYVASAVGAGLVDVLLALAFPGRLGYPVLGCAAASFALLTAFWQVFGDQPVSVFGSSPMKGKWVFFALVALVTVLFAAGNNPGFGVEVGGVAMGWLLVTGRWRPQKLGRWLDERTHSLRRRLDPRRRRLRVIQFCFDTPPGLWQQHAGMRGG